MTMRGFIWDLDNTLYRYQDVSLDSGALIAAHMAQERGIKLSTDELVQQSHLSYKTYGTSYHFLIHDFGCDENEVHQDFHDRMDLSAIARKNHDVAAAFRQHKGEHVLLTHASRRWAERVLQFQDLTEFFPPERILPVEEVGFARKNLGTASFEIALSRLGTRIEETAMIEDSLVNLVHPYQMGLWTVYIHHGRPLDPLPPYVKSQFANAMDVMATL